jgi:hypothetical protein
MPLAGGGVAPANVWGRLKQIVVTDAGVHLYSLLREEVAAIRRRMLATAELDKLVRLTEFLEKLQEPLRPSAGSPKR